MRKKSETNANKCKKVAQDPPKSSDSTPYAKPPQKGPRPSQGRFGRELFEVIVQHAGGEGPPRIGTLREAERDSAGVLP